MCTHIIKCSNDTVGLVVCPKSLRMLVLKCIIAAYLCCYISKVKKGSSLHLKIVKKYKV